MLKSTNEKSSTKISPSLVVDNLSVSKRLGSIGNKDRANTGRAVNRNRQNRQQPNFQNLASDKTIKRQPTSANDPIEVSNFRQKSHSLKIHQSIF